MERPRYRVPAGSSRTGSIGAGRAPSASVPLPAMGGLEAGQHRRRLAGFLPSRQHINSLIARSGPTVLSRARFLARNNGYANNAVEVWASDAVGAGIVPSSRVADKNKRKQIHDLFRDWTDESDAEGLTDFYGQQRRGGREGFLAGECFIRRRPRYLTDGLTVPLQLQMLPSEMLDHNYTTMLPNGGAIRQGIEFDRIGRRVAYHFWRRHPGDSTDLALPAGLRTRVPAEDVIHIVDPLEGGQLRGVSRLAPAIVRMWIFDQYDDAELERKKTAALFAGFVKRPDPNGTLLDKLAEDEAQDGTAMPRLEPGMMAQLMPGEEIDFSEPADSGQSYEPFQYRTLLQISVATGIPYYKLTGDLKATNFASMRGGEIGYRRRIESFQHAVMVFQMCRTIWRWWMDAAVLSGALDLPGYAENPAPWLAVDWMPPKFDWVDPLKDVLATKAAVRSGLVPYSAAVASNGYQPEQVLDDAENLAREMDKRGIVFDIDARRVTNAGVGQFVDPKNLDDNPATPE